MRHPLPHPRKMAPRIMTGVGLLLAGCTSGFPSVAQFAGRYEDAYPDRQLDRVTRVVDEDRTGAGFKGHFDVSYHSPGGGEAGTDRISYFGVADGVTSERRF